MVDNGVILAPDQRDCAAERERQIGEAAFVGEAAALVVHQHGAVNADREGGVVFAPHAVGVLVGAREFVASNAPLSGQLATCGGNHVDAFADGQHVAQGVHVRAELLLHHFVVAKKTASAHDDGRCLHVDDLLVLFALHADAGAFLHEQRFACGAEHELGTVGLAPLLQRPHAVHTLLLGFGIFRIGLEVAANRLVAGAVVIGTKTGRNTEIVGELVDSGTRKFDCLFNGAAVGCPVGVFHNVAEGLFNAEVDAGFLLELRAYHERAARHRAIGNTDVLALLDYDGFFASAARLDGCPHAGAARTNDGDVAFHGLVGGFDLGCFGVVF